MLISVLLCAATMACGKHHTVNSPAHGIGVFAEVGATERGDASWYGEPYHGRRAASGEIFDMEQLTAAHRTLPFQTWVRVTNLDNGKAVDVRITDRGPFVDGRIIDLSRAAARKIDLLRTGLARVELRVIEAPELDDALPVETVASAAPPFASKIPASPAADSEHPSSVPSSMDNTATDPPDPAPETPKPATPRRAKASSTGFAIQVGSFRDRDRAEAVAASLLEGSRRTAGEGKPPQVRVLVSEQGMWRVWVGQNLSTEAASQLLEQMKSVVEQAFIVRESAR